MSKKFGTDRLDKWDKNLKNWEDSELYYPSEDEEHEEEDNKYESRERERA